MLVTNELLGFELNELKYNKAFLTNGSSSVDTAVAGPKYEGPRLIGEEYDCIDDGPNDLDGDGTNEPLLIDAIGESPGADAGPPEEAPVVLIVLFFVKGFWPLVVTIIDPFGAPGTGGTRGSVIILPIEVTSIAESNLSIPKGLYLYMNKTIKKPINIDNQ
jgi:hypothetical protein